MKFGESHPFADPVSPRDPSGENEAEPTILDKFLNYACRHFPSFRRDAAVRRCVNGLPSADQALSLNPRTERCPEM